MCVHVYVCMCVYVCVCVHVCVYVYVGVCGVEEQGCCGSVYFRGGKSV